MALQSLAHSPKAAPTTALAQARRWLNGPTSVHGGIPMERFQNKEQAKPSKPPQNAAATDEI